MARRGTERVLDGCLDRSVLGSVVVGHHDQLERSSDMLWTILIILAIVALAVFIFTRVRGGRSRL